MNVPFDVRRVSGLSSTDDIALLSDSAEAIQDAFDNIDSFAKVVGLRTNASKTRVMSTQPRPGTQHTINLGGVLPDDVDSFKYLNSTRQLVSLRMKSAEGLALRVVPQPA